MVSTIFYPAEASMSIYYQDEGRRRGPPSSFLNPGWGVGGVS